MREFFSDLFRLGKELRDGEFGRWVQLAAGIGLVLLTVISLGSRVCRVCKAAWRWVWGVKDDGPEEPEGS